MIRNWKDFDDRLKEIALIELDVKEAERVRSLALITAEATYRGATATRTAAGLSLRKELEGFYRKNRREAESGGKRSKEFHFGRAGIRATAAKLRLLKGFKWPDVVAALHAAAEAGLIKTKESVDKEKLKRAGKSADALARLGVSLKAGEEFFIDTYPEQAIGAAS